MLKSIYETLQNQVKKKQDKVGDPFLEEQILILALRVSSVLYRRSMP